MRDKRESTPLNVDARDEDEVLADRLPKVLASRLRAARSAVGMAQGAVADAMADRGFSWRQTTVAKSEAADRPVLFAEVAALSRIYRRPIEYFLYPGTGLDSVIDEAKLKMESLESEISDAERHLSALKQDAELYRSAIELASAIARYRNTSDSGPLLEDLRDLLKHWGPRLMLLRPVFDAVDLTLDEVAAVDYEAVRDVAQAEWDRYQLVTREDLMYESPENLIRLSDFMEGKKVPSEYLEALRRGLEWPDAMAPRLADLLIEAVHVQDGFDY